MDWLHNIVTITGANIDNAGVPYFWATPAGLICIFTIAACSLIAVFSKRANSDFPTMFYNWVLAIVCVVVIIHVAEDSNPIHQLQIILISLACKKLWDTYLLFRKK